MDQLAMTGRSSSPAASHSRLWLFWVPAISLLLSSAVIRIFDLDLWCASLFWDSLAGWKLDHAWWVRFLYKFGPLPALVAGGLGAAYCLRYFLGWGTPRNLRRAAFALILLLLGPELIVNLTLKNHFGRPRPRQVKDFGGEYRFEPIGEFSPGEEGKSFPCGHAAAGFFWLGMAVYFRKESPKFAAMLSILGILYGMFIGLARMAQGGHWLSDVLWSAALVYFSALLIQLLPFFRPLPQDQPTPVNAHAEPGVTTPYVAS
jgi:lipid A 4'-phosphatase